MSLANVTEGSARATVLKVTRTEPSRGFVAGVRPNRRMFRQSRYNPYLRRPRSAKMQKELKERLTAWSLKVAEHGHQFKVIDEAQKILVVREMMPKDIKREFLKEARRAPRAASLMGTLTRTREAMGAKGKARAKARARAKTDTAMTVASKGISW